MGGQQKDFISDIVFFQHQDGMRLKIRRHFLQCNVLCHVKIKDPPIGLIKTMRTAMTSLISQDVEALLLPKFHRINKKLPKEVSKCHHEPICLLFLLVFKSNIFPLLFACMVLFSLFICFHSNFTFVCKKYILFG